MPKLTVEVQVFRTLFQSKVMEVTVEEAGVGIEDLKEMALDEGRLRGEEEPVEGKNGWEDDDLEVTEVEIYQ